MPTTAVDSPSSMNILGGRNRPGSQPGAKRPVPAANSKKACKGERRHAPNTKTDVLNRETGLKPLSVKDELVMRSTASLSSLSNSGWKSMYKLMTQA